MWILLRTSTTVKTSILNDSQTHSNGHFTDRYFPDGHFSDQTHLWCTFPRPYTSHPEEIWGQRFQRGSGLLPSIHANFYWFKLFCRLLYTSFCLYVLLSRTQAFTNCVHVTCTQTVLRVHENSCTVLIPLCKNNLNLPISHKDHYALRK